MTIPKANVDSPAGVAAAATPPLPAIHDASQQARNLRQVLQDDKQRIGCFLGAGCPLGVYDAAGTKSVVLIPAVAELTKRVADGLHAVDTAPGATSKFKANWDALCAECKPADNQDPTVEDVLTELRTLANRRGSAEILGMSKKDLGELDDKVCALILAEVQKSLPSYRNAYDRFASWI
ncbi:hypothetical protein, partial [Burkholderia pseudomallei]